MLSGTLKKMRATLGTDNHADEVNYFLPLGAEELPLNQFIGHPLKLEFPEKIKSHNFDKNPLVEGTLLGIKGQYLMFDTGIINIRKFSSYNVQVSA